MGEAMSVLILHNRPRESLAGGEPALESELGVIAQVDAVRAALRRLGVPCRVAGASSLGEVRARLGSAREKIVFNLVESLPDAPQDANTVPTLCRAHGLACTGNPAEALTYCLDKWTTRCLLEGEGIQVAPGWLVREGDRIEARPQVEPPWIVKPAHSDASEGIEVATSVVRTLPALAEAVSRVHTQLRQPALVEQVVGEREINVSVIELDGRLRVLPLAEIDFSGLPPGHPPIVDYAAKWHEDSPAYRSTPRVIPAPLAPSGAQEVERIALACFEALGCRGYARVDLRLCSERGPFVLEVNPNPDITPGAGFPAALEAAGISYAAFVQAMLRAALRPPAQPSPAPQRVEGTPETRAGVPADIEAIVALTRATGLFSTDELDIAREVATSACVEGPGGHYQLQVAVDGVDVVGWVCAGPTPGTRATWDLYWIAVHPSAQGRGLGRRLLRCAEEGLRAAGGRLCVVETSSRAEYVGTRRFYGLAGYVVGARIPDFYAPGDDKVFFTRTFPNLESGGASSR